MATFFGEIVFPDSRIADEEDYELNGEEEFPQCQLTLKLEEGELKKKYSNVYVLDRLTSDAIRRPISQLKKVAEIVSQRNDKKEFVENSGLDSRDPKPTQVFEIDNSTCAILASEDISEESFHDFALKTMTFASPQSTFLVLAVSPAAIFQSDMSSEDWNAPFVRSLKTSSYKQNPIAKPLEQPNIISGIPAAILSRCQIDNIPALAFVVYIDTRSVDSVAWEALRPCVKSSPGGHKLADLPVLCDKRETGGNLYM